MSAHAQHHIQRLSLGNRRMSAASIAAEVEEVGGQLVSAQTILCTLHQISLHGCCPRRKSLLKMMHKKACKQSELRTWITGTCVLWSVETNINLFDSDSVKHVWWQPGCECKISVSCLQSSMVVGGS